MLAISERRVVSRARALVGLYDTVTIAANMAMTQMTIISSTSVKPLTLFFMSLV